MKFDPLSGLPGVEAQLSPVGFKVLITIDACLSCIGFPTVEHRLPLLTHVHSTKDQVLEILSNPQCLRLSSTKRENPDTSQVLCSYGFS